MKNADVFLAHELNIICTFIEAAANSASSTHSTIGVNAENALNINSHFQHCQVWWQHSNGGPDLW